MKVKKLKKLLLKLNSIKSDMIPILECIHLEPGKLVYDTLTSQVKVPFENEVRGSFDMKFLKDMVSKLDPEDVISFTDSEHGAWIHILVNKEDIGKVVNEDPKNQDRVKHDWVDKSFDRYLGRLQTHHKDILKEAIDYCSNDELRPAMTCIEVSDHIVATNGHLMLFEKLKEPFIPVFDQKVYTEMSNFETITDGCEKILGNPFAYKPEQKSRKLLIEKSMAKFLLDFLNEEDLSFSSYTVISKKRTQSGKEIEFFGNSYIKVSNSEMDIYFRMMDEIYPDWKNVIPVNILDEKTGKTSYNEVIINIDRKGFMKWVATSLTFANDVTHQVALHAAFDGTLTINSENLDFDKSFEKKILTSINISNTSDEKLQRRIGFNGKLLLGILSKSKDKIATIKFFRPNTGAIIDGNKLLMPVMLNKYINA